MSDRSSPAARVSHLPFISIVLLLLVVGLVIYVKATSAPNSKRVNVALVTWNEDPFWDPVMQGARDAAEEVNAQLTIVQSKPDLETQNQHIHDLLAKGVQGIAISPNDPKAQTAILKEASDKGVLVTIDVDAPESQRRVFVGIDNYGAGHFAADQVRLAVPEGGDVIVTVGSIDMPHGRNRRQGLIDGLLDRPFRPDHENDALEAPLQGSKYSIVASVIDHGDPARSTALLVDALKAHPETKCVVGLFSYSAGAALAAIDQVGKHGQIKVIAFDESESTQAGIEAGTIFSSILQDQYRIGHEAIRVLAEELRTPSEKGPSGPRITLVEIAYLDKDNIQSLRESRNIRVPKTSPTSQPTVSASP